MTMGNLFEDHSAATTGEVLTRLLDAKGFRLERIVSTGQATPAGEWYDQDQCEWVMLLTGSAGLRVHGESRVRVLKPGDYVVIPAHKRHRVEWTDRNEKTVWLALHYNESD